MESDVLVKFTEIGVQFAALGGVAAAITIVVNILKYFSVIKEEKVAMWVGILQLVGYLALYVTKIFRPDFSPAGIDAVALEIATVATYLLSFLVQFGIGKLTHNIVRGVPVIGKSYTYDATKLTVKKA
jgi:hypothetical protein